METRPAWQAAFDAELQAAENARAAGNEGRARVCARRAAGVVAGEYFQRQEITFRHPSAYEKLKFLSQLDRVPAPVQAVASHFLERVSTEWRLPVDADLLQDARWLAAELL
jgi:hypothetical protein